MGTTIKPDGSSRKQILLAACIFMGLAHIMYLKQYLKGAVLAAVEVIFILASPAIYTNIRKMLALQGNLNNPSSFRLIDGLFYLILAIMFIIVYVITIKNAMTSYEDFCLDGRMKSQKESVAGMAGKSFPIFAMAPAFLLILFFVVVPLLFSMLAAFTSYSDSGEIKGGANSFGWVGFENFSTMFSGTSGWSGSFASVAVWTVVWGFLATITCYLGGMIMAVILYEAKLKVTPVFRAILILPYAVPSLLTISVWNNLLDGKKFGIINATLIQFGIIDEKSPIQFLSSSSGSARMWCILINMWCGIPYFMLLVTGQMTAISADVYEAAAIDGANEFQVFTNITLPLVVYQTAPLIIMSFTHNINNFGAVYYLTGGGPNTDQTTITKAGGTDIFISWIYKISTDSKQYNMGAVLAIFVFAVLAPFAIFNFINTKSFKEGEL